MDNSNTAKTTISNDESSNGVVVKSDDRGCSLSYHINTLISRALSAPSPEQNLSASSGLSVASRLGEPEMAKDQK